MKKIKITEAQAKMLKEMENPVSKNKLLKITESQYKRILEMESIELQKEDELVGVDMPSSKVPSKAVTKNFNSGLDKGVKKDIGKLYEDFINELYGINESGSNKYESLIKLMEMAGLIENNKIRRDKFNNDKNRVKEVISHGLNEMVRGGSFYKVMESMETKLNEDYLNPQLTSVEESLTQEINGVIGSDVASVSMGIYQATGEGYGKISIMIKDDIDETLFNSLVDFVTSKGFQVDASQSTNEFEVGEGRYYFPRIKFTFDPNSVETVDEMTSAASSGSYEGGMSLGNKFKSNVPEELEEVTTTTSVGGDSGSFAYDAPAGNGSDFWTKGNKQNKRMEEGYTDEEKEKMNRYTTLMSMYKNASNPERSDLKPQLMKAAKKLGIKLDLSENALKNTQFPGGEFVNFDDCVKYNNNKVAQNGGCNQGDSGVVKTKGSSDSVVAKKNVYETVAEKTGKTVEEVKAIINKSK